MDNLGDLIDLTQDLSKVAIIDESGRVTYQQLHDMSNYVANNLTNEGLKPGDRIGICGDNSIDFVAMYLGVLKMGGVAVLLDPSYSPEKITAVAKNANVKFLWRGEEIPKDASSEFEIYQVDNETPAVIIYTGKELKGVILPHGHKRLIKQKSNYTAAVHRRAIITDPCCYMNGWGNLNIVLSGHGTLVLLKKFEVKEFLKRVAHHRINSIVGVPYILDIMQTSKLSSMLALQTVFHISLSFSTPSQELIVNLRKIFPKANINNNYSLTEIGVNLFGKHPTLPTPQGSVGYPMLGLEYRLVDDALQVRSPSMLTGYLDGTNNLTEDGYFITGDLFDVDSDGFYFFRERVS